MHFRNSNDIAIAIKHLEQWGDWKEDSKIGEALAYQIMYGQEILSYKGVIRVNFPRTTSSKLFKEDKALLE